MVETLGFEVFVDDNASNSAGKVGGTIKKLSVDLEAAQVKVAKATEKVDAAVKDYGKDTLQAREATVRLAQAELAAEKASERLGQAQKQLGQAVEESGNAVEESVSKWARLKDAGAVAGTAAAAAIGKGFVDNLNIESGRAKLQAQLGLTGAEAQKAGALAGDIYGQNFGDSLDSVNQALSTTWSAMGQIGVTSTASIGDATKAALTLSTTFGTDVNESVRAVSSMMRNNLAKNSTEAFDLIARGMQKGLNSSDDLLDTLNEYSPQFKKLGLSGRDAMNLITEGMQAGAFNTDKVADAIKEFSIRAVDGSKLTSEGFRAIGLDATKTAQAIAQGGPAAREAFGQVLQGLSSIKDPLAQEQAGVALFGSQWEDVGPQVVLAMSLSRDAIGDTTGTIKDMNEALGSTGAAKIETWRRQFEEFLQTAAGAPGVIGATVAGVAALGPSALSAAGDIGSLVTGLKDLNISGARTKTVLYGVGAAAATLAAGQIAGAAFGKNVSVGADTATKALREYVKTGEMSSVITEDLNDTLNTLADKGFAGFNSKMNDVMESLFGMRDVDFGPLGEGIGLAEQKVASLDAALAKMVASNDAETAAEAFKKLSEAAASQGLSADRIKQLFPQYQNAIDGLANSTKTQTTATNASSLSVDKQRAAFAAATSEALGFANALLGLRGGEVAYWAAVDGATAALKQNGATLDVHTEKGRANRMALDSQARAAVEYIQDLQNSNTPAKEFNKNLDDMRARLILAATRFGMAKGEAEAYAARILGIPRMAVTNVQLNASGALSQLNAVRVQLSQINGRTVRAYVNVDYQGNIGGPRGVAVARAAGGSIPGGPSSVDSVPAMLAPGEYVVNAFSAARNRPLLDAINGGTGYAAGGYVMPRSTGNTSAGMVRVEVVGNDRALVDLIRRLVRIRGGGDVQTAFGVA